MEDYCALNGFFTEEERADFLQSASQRVSIREYKSGPTDEQAERIAGLAEKYALPGVRLLPVRVIDKQVFRTLPLVGGVRGTDLAVAVLADKTPHADLYAGISGEALVLGAVGMGLGTCWLGSARTRALPIEAKEGERVLGVIAIGAYEARKILRKRKKLSELTGSDPASWPFWAYNAAETVRIAPSALNLQPWRLAYAGHTLLLRAHGPAGKLDMGIAMLHMHIGVGEREHELDWGDENCVARLRILGGINA